MSRKKVLLTSLIVIVLVVSACALLFLHIRNSQEPAAEPETTQEESTKAIDFTVLDYDLNEVHLFDYSGKPVILNFWASWCPDCLREFPSFQSLYEEYGDESQFMMIDLVDGTEDDVAARYKAIRKELKLYAKKLAEKPEIVVLNKIDALTPDEIAEKTAALQKAARKKPLQMSGAAHEGTDAVLKKLIPYVAAEREARRAESERRKNED